MLGVSNTLKLENRDYHTDEPIPEHDESDDNKETSEILCEECNDDKESADNLSDLIDEYYKEYDASLTGMKAGLDNRHRRNSARALPEDG